MPELYLADALGAVGKPMIRVHTAGCVGGSTAIVAAKLVMAGIHERVLTVAFEKQSESNATWGLSVRDAVPGAARRRCRRLLRADHPGVHPPVGRAASTSATSSSVKDRLNALRNPKAHLHLPDIDLQDGARSRSCSGTRCATSTSARAPTARWRWSSAARTSPTPRPGPAAWIHGTAMRSRADDVRRAATR